ncbi:MAG: hypothetical protein IPL78_25405 [Chloroflexi bacterium]|nr:hypothetical protein [Chloroflexota bacterium]
MVTLALIMLVTALGIPTPVSASGSTLTVDLNGNWISSVSVQLWSSDGTTLFWTAANQHGGVRNYAVTPGTYDVKFIQGPNTMSAKTRIAWQLHLMMSADLTVNLTKLAASGDNSRERRRCLDKRQSTRW